MEWVEGIKKSTRLVLTLFFRALINSNLLEFKESDSFIEITSFHANSLNILPHLKRTPQTKELR